jgi:hydroxypyruvate isomerase
VIRWSAHLSTLFRELALEERPAAAHRAGFDFVESWWPPAESAERFAHELRRYGYEPVCLNCFGGDLARGERGFLNVPGRYDQTLAEFAAALAYGAGVRARAINVLVGRSLRDVPRSRQHDLVVSTLRTIAAQAATAGVIVLVEHLSELDVPGSLVPTPQAAVELIEEVGSDSVALLYDAYHAAAAGFEPCRQVAGLVEWIGHVQYADFPGRGAPGSGRIDLGRLVEALSGAGYRGAIGLEFHPRDVTPELAAILGAHERPLGGRR